MNKGFSLASYYAMAIVAGLGIAWRFFVHLVPIAVMLYLGLIVIKSWQTDSRHKYVDLGGYAVCFGLYLFL